MIHPSGARLPLVRSFGPCFFLAVVACGQPPAGVPVKAHVDAGPSVPDATVDPVGAVDASPVTGPHRTLFVGNSYVYVNDVAGHYRTFAGALSPGASVEQVTPGGYTLAQHAEDARTDGTPLARWLRTGTAEETSFNVVVLQEQSQLGGFPSFGHHAAMRAASIAAASELSALARARGALVVLYLTWGREDGDPASGLWRGTYADMQDWLDEGYLGLAALLRERGSNVRVAPVGGGFRIVFEDVTRAGGDPLAEGSDFDALYEPDGSHPSLRGAYLAACILAGTATATDVRGFLDEPTLGPAVSRGLRDVCARALVDPRWHVPTVRRPDAVLVGGRASGERFGASVALSAGATRVLVGAEGYTDGGSARMFVGAAAGWAEEALWRGSPWFARTVSMSGDGAQALVGAPWRHYARDGATWSEEPAAAPSLGDNDRFAALSADGRRVIASVAGPGVGPEDVVARVLVRTGGAWVEEGVLRGRSAVHFNPPVAIDGAGERAIVGERPCRVGVRTAAGWVEEATLSVSGGSVAISADGRRALVGEQAANRAVMFVRSGASWTEEATLRGSLNVPRGLGSPIALSADGRRAVVGAPLDATAAMGWVSGSARVYVLRDGAYRPEHLLVPPTPLATGTGAPKFGGAVAMSPDGTRVVVGAPDTADGSTHAVGEAYTFTLP